MAGAGLADCPSCGGLLPVGRRCCPHCHCKYSALKAWQLAAAAALGVGATGCGDRALPPSADGAAAAFDAGVDHSTPPMNIDYGPPFPRDLSGED